MFREASNPIDAVLNFVDSNANFRVLAYVVLKDLIGLLRWVFFRVR